MNDRSIHDPIEQRHRSLRVPQVFAPCLKVNVVLLYLLTRWLMVEAGEAHRIDPGKRTCGKHCSRPIPNESAVSCCHGCSNESLSTQLHSDPVDIIRASKTPTRKANTANEVNYGSRKLSTIGSYAPKGFVPEVAVPQGVEQADGRDSSIRVVHDQISRGVDWIKVYADSATRGKSFNFLSSTPGSPRCWEEECS